MEINKIHNIDFLNNTLPDKCAQLIIADPPYFEVKGSFDFIWKSFDDYLKDVEKWAIECKRLLADNGTLFWYGHAKKLAYSQIIIDLYFKLENNIAIEFNRQTKKSVGKYRIFTPVSDRLLMYSLEFGSIKTTFSNYILELMKINSISEKDLRKLFISKNGNHTGCVSNWLKGESIPSQEQFDKINNKFGFSALDKVQEYLNTITDKNEMSKILLENGICKNNNSAKQNANNILNYKSAKPQFITEFQYNSIQNNNKITYEELKNKYENSRRYFNNIFNLFDIMKFDQESHKTKMYDHDTVKPEALTRALILTCSRPNDLVLVPFSGSGTECAMAAKENRNFIGFDIENKYVEMGNKRCVEHLRKQFLFS